MTAKKIITCIVLILVLAVCEVLGIIGYKLHRERSEQTAKDEAEPKTPFSELKAEDVSGAAIDLLGKSAEISEAEAEPLVKLLREIVIYEEYEPEPLIGDGGIVTVSLKDGTTVTVAPYGLMYVRINEVCYKAWQEPVENLDYFIYSIIANGGYNYEK